MISLPRRHISCPFKVISASAAISNLLHRARMLRILDHPCESWLWDVPKLQTLAARPRTVWRVWSREDQQPEREAEAFG